MRIERAADPEQGSAAIERLLRLLPEWFGIEASLREYVDNARLLPTYLALTDDDEVVGCLTLRRRFEWTTEIDVMAVHPQWHRRGVGTALLNGIETHLRDNGVQMLTVKTLGSSHPDPGYANTRRFYEARGFLALEEFPELWPENPCLFMAKSLPKTRSPWFR